MVAADALASTLVSHATVYATGGLEVFPVNPRDKRPIVSQHQATTASIGLPPGGSAGPQR
jgi:hypothetical protein